MQDFTNSVTTAFRLLVDFDHELQEIVALSLQVSVTASMVAAVIGMPLGAFLAISRFPLRGFVVALITALMGLPPVVVGLVAYLLLSNGGLLGPLQLLYTPTAMIFAQTLLIIPIIAALTRQSLEGLHDRLSDQLTLLGISRAQRLRTLLWEGRYELLITFLAGFGRAIAEVGAVIIVGGNINHVTRVMTTTIALETSRGNLALALGLGIVLVCIAVTANTLVLYLGYWSRRRSHGQN